MNNAKSVVFIVSGVIGLRGELRTTLATLDVDVTEVNSATDYLRHPQRPAAACVVIDVDLPDMSGFELQGSVRETDASVVIVSRAGNIWESVRALKMGAVDYLPAPVSSFALLRAVNAAIAKDCRVRERRQCFASLTPREREIARMVVRGFRNKIIAADLGISTVTVQIHRGKIMRKMKARCLPDLVRMSDELGFGLGAA